MNIKVKMTAKTAALIFLLTLISGAYAYLTLALLLMDFFPLWLDIMAVMGVLGLIGLWLLFFYESFKNKAIKQIAVTFLILGIVAAVTVSITGFVIMFDMREVLSTFIGFSLTWGLLIIVACTLYAMKKKIFKKQTNPLSNEKE